MYPVITKMKALNPRVSARAVGVVKTVLKPSRMPGLPATGAFSSRGMSFRRRIMMMPQTTPAPPKMRKENFQPRLSAIRPASQPARMTPT